MHNHDVLFAGKKVKKCPTVLRPYYALYLYIKFGGTKRGIRIYFLYLFKTGSIYIYIYIGTRAQYNYIIHYIK